MRTLETTLLQPYSGHVTHSVLVSATGSLMYVYHHHICVRVFEADCIVPIAKKMQCSETITGERRGLFDGAWPLPIGGSARYVFVLISAN